MDNEHSCLSATVPNVLTVVLRPDDVRAALAGFSLSAAFFAGAAFFVTVAFFAAVFAFVAGVVPVAA